MDRNLAKLFSVLNSMIKAKKKRGHNSAKVLGRIISSFVGK
jgi:hypothetical protein